MGSIDDGDDDLCVMIGTPFDVPEENEPLPKTSKVEDQIVTDEKGRRRFHGAFTGGFSAGYFNTVGSKEGWSPSTFKSSRSKKNESHEETRTISKPEDFMDEEDFAEHGIAPKKLKTAFSDCSTDDSKFESQKKSFLRAVDDGEVHSAIPGGADPLVNLLAPPKHSIGIQLLKKMGWKPGHGIGEKIELSPEKENTSTIKKKVYGCALPPKSRVESIDMQTFAMMLAPKDIQPITFQQKDNFHGIGYSGIVTIETMLRNSTNTSDKSFRPSGKGKKGIRGQAFGIGVFEEEDDDIYGDNSYSSYDMTMCDDKDEKDGWTGTTSKPKTYKGCLQGFIKSSKILKIVITPVTIQLTSDVPKHVFPEDRKNKESTMKDSVNVSNASTHTKLSSQDRSNLLGEVTKGMQDIKHWTLKWDQSEDATEKDKEKPSVKIESAEIAEKSSSGDTKTLKPSRWDKDVDHIRPKQSKSWTEVTSRFKDSPVSTKSNGVFQPFSRYPEKQARYEIYVEAMKKGYKPDFKYDRVLTEWEKEQEVAEFSRAAVLYKPLSSMTNRFVRANFIDNEDATGKMNEIEKPVDQKAAEMGMFGKLTRTILNWHPDPILCKRMNIPNPYRNSSVKGVPNRSKKQTSFFSNSVSDNTKAITLSKNQSDEEEEEEDEFFSRIKKNKQKLLKNKAGPLSHLNIKLGCHKSGPDSEKVGNTTTADDNVTKEVIIKPSIDIFKAIFEDSDSEGSNDESDNKKDANESNPVTTNVTSLSSDFVETESKVNCEITEQSSKADLKNFQDIPMKGSSSDKNNKPNMFLPLAFLNPDSSHENKIPTKTTECKLENQKLSNEKNRVVSMSNRTEERSSSQDSSKNKNSISMKTDQSNSYIQDSSKNKNSISVKNDETSSSIHDPSKNKNSISVKNDQTSSSMQDPSKNKNSVSMEKDHGSSSIHKHHDRSKHKKRKKEKKSKKHKKKKYTSEDSESDSDNYKSSKKKTKKKYSSEESDTELNKSTKKKKIYVSNDSDSDSNKKYKKKKYKRHRSSSASSEDDTAVPTNEVLLQKLKKIAQSSRRPTAADFM